MAPKEEDTPLEIQSETPDGTSKENQVDGEVYEEDENEIDVTLEPASREEEIKNIGIIQHMTRVGESLLKIYDSVDIEEEEKPELYEKYREILWQDVEMIKEQKKGYEEELPPNVSNITKPIDDNMLKVMDSCLGVINEYVFFMSEEEKDPEVISNCFDVLEQTSYLLDETEEMLRAVFESVETTGGIIGEA